jgi:hypothetical protein
MIRTNEHMYTDYGQTENPRNRTDPQRSCASFVETELSAGGRGESEIAACLRVDYE